MKEIIAIIRPNKVNATKKVLDELDLPFMTAIQVLGRGHQRGIASELDLDIHPHLLAKARTMGMKYIPKRMLVIVAKNEDTDTIVKAIIKANQTFQIGDGKIFVCPADNAIRISTKESGGAALK
ncbi:MAG: P-II family nitrogen regulator [Dysgonomonas sp.]